MEEEDISTTLDPSLPQGPGWRADLSRADRIKVCKLIVQKLHCTFSRSTFLFLWFEAIVSSMVFFSFCRELTVYFSSLCGSEKCVTLYYALLCIVFVIFHARAKYSTIKRSPWRPCATWQAGSRPTP